MAGEGTSVGLITLDLKIIDTVREQLLSISRKAEGGAKDSFSQVGETMAQSMAKPLENLDKAIKAPLERVEKQMEETAEEQGKRLDAIIQQSVDKLNKPREVSDDWIRFEGARKAAPTPKPQEDTAAPKATGKPMEVFKAAEDAVELLNQKLGNTNSLIGEQEAKLAQLMQQYAAIADSKGAGSAEALDLDSKITAAQGKLISLQQSANSAQAAIQKAAEAPALAAQKASDAAANAAKKAADAAAQAAKRAKAKTEKPFPI